MKLTSKSRVAVTALADILHSSSDKFVSLRDISIRQKISLTFLEQLFYKLKKNKIVISNRGVNGGYKLVADPSKISIFDIIDAVEEKIDTTQCGGLQNCKNEKKCITHDFWDGFNSHILNYLKDKKLTEILINN